MSLTLYHTPHFQVFIDNQGNVTGSIGDKTVQVRGLPQRLDPKNFPAAAELIRHGNFSSNDRTITLSVKLRGGGSSWSQCFRR